MNYWKKKKQGEILHTQEEKIQQAKIYLELTRKMIDDYNKSKEEEKCQSTKTN